MGAFLRIADAKDASCLPLLKHINDAQPFGAKGEKRNASKSKNFKKFLVASCKEG